MIVDSSAIIAILRDEPEQTRFTDVLEQQPGAALPAPAYLETTIVADRSSDPRVSFLLDRLLEDFGVVIVAFTAEHARLARRAHHAYGRGSGSPARLNFGDCCVYAVASAADEPLLYKGDDFVHTDLRSVLDL